MPPITITEKDFLVLAMAATDARDSGEDDQAKALDKLARMANAALTAASAGHKVVGMLGISTTKLRWQHMPSVLAEMPRRAPRRRA